MNNSEFELLDLIERYAFEALSETQQKPVLEQMDATEYNQMHLLHKISSENQQPLESHTAFKKQLINQFEQLHSQPKISWYQRQIPIWKAASVLVLLGGAIFFLQRNYPNSKLKTDETTSPVLTVIKTIHDTLFLPQNNSTAIAVSNTVVKKQSASPVSPKGESGDSIAKITYSPSSDFQTEKITTWKTYQNKIEPNKSHSILNNRVVADFVFAGPQ